MNFPEHPWYGKKVAFLGDSITDADHVGTTRNYWQFLAEDLQIVPLVYGVNGHKWSEIPAQAAKLKAEHGADVDAVVVFAGTNDFRGSIPLGAWFNLTAGPVNVNGQEVTSLKRELCFEPAAFRGRINIAMRQLKHDFPVQQIVLLTPLHRAFAAFNENNVQPPECWANLTGAFVDEYVQAVREAGSLWSVPVIDLFSLSGLYPADDAYAGYFHDAQTDRLHPNCAGHRRIAKVLECQLAVLPADFKE